MKLKTINLKGKEYCQVVDRLKYFNDTHKNGSIETSYDLTTKGVVFTAKVFIEGNLRATGHSYKPMTSEFNLEKAETRAIGRALAIFGIGADASISSYEEAQEAINQQNKQRNPYE